MSAVTRNDDVSPDEETPLLSSKSTPKKNPVPWAQVSILLFLQLAEPLTSQVIYPFTPEARHFLPTLFIFFSRILCSSFAMSGLPTAMSLV
jgi:hypothetical protein